MFVLQPEEFAEHETGCSCVSTHCYRVTILCRIDYIVIEYMKIINRHSFMPSYTHMISEPTSRGYTIIGGESTHGVT